MQLNESPSSPGHFPHKEGGRGVNALRVQRAASLEKPLAPPGGRGVGGEGLSFISFGRGI